MPNYTNNGAADIYIENLSGEIVPLKPGQSMDTYLFYSDANLGRNSELPLKNPVTGNTLVTLGAAQDHVLDSETNYFMVVDITDEVTVRPQRDDATPLMLNAKHNSDVVIHNRTRNYYDRVRVSGSGTCTIIEFSEM